jgi:acyl phosphate:glycerol-3-phosphate acyltransferase
LGNGFSPFLRFDGGKGVSTAVGIFTALFSLSYGLWLVQALLMIAVLARSMAFASVAVFALIPMVHWKLGLYQDMPTILFVTGVAVWIAFRHRVNFQSWWKGK